MTSATSNGSSAPNARAGARTAPAGSTPTHITGLDQLAGGHPDALRDLFMAGRPTDPTELGPSPRGRLLSLEPTRGIHFLVRPLVVAIGQSGLLWQGKTFDPDGTGANVVLGRQTARFVFETEPSLIDGAKALVLRYDSPLHDNPWPLRNVRDELRTVGDGIAIGPVCFSAVAHDERKVIAWFGLERQR
jgi:hypothetical protein